MASELVGGFADADSEDVYVFRHDDGAVTVLRADAKPLRLDVAQRDALRELLDRAAMPGVSRD